MSALAADARLVLVLLRRRPILVAWTSLVSIWFLLMLLDSELRPNAIAEVWGVVGAGTVVWLLLESRSEDVQRRAWLHWHRDEVRQLLEQVLGYAGPSAANALDLSLEEWQALNGAPTRAARREAESRAWEKVRLLREGLNRGEFVSPQAGEEQFLSGLNMQGRAVEWVSRPSWLGRFTELERAVRAYTDACRRPPRLGRPTSMTEEIGRLRQIHFTLITAAETSLTLVSTCSDLLEEAGLLPSN